MRIKLFSLLSIIYILIIAGLAFYLKLGDYTLTLFGLSATLPVLLWLVLGLVIFWLLAVLHMGFYGFLRGLKFAHFARDAARFEDLIENLLLERPGEVYFKTSEFAQAALLTRSLKNHAKTQLAKINEALDALAALENGELINASKFRLDPSNPLFIKNEKNHIEKDVLYALARVKNLSEIKSELDLVAFAKVLKSGTYAQIKGLKITKTPTQLLHLIKRCRDKSLELSAPEFEALLNSVALSEAEYVEIAKLCARLFSPEQLLAIFEKLKNQRAEAGRAYLYLLAEFGLLAQLREAGAEGDFAAFLALREKNIKIDPARLIQ